MALAAGFRHARGRVVVTLDADLQEDPAEIPRLIERLSDGYDLVGAWRRTRRDRAGKVFGSRLFNRVVSLVGGVRFRDINCGLKVLRREVVEDVSLAGGFHRFLPLLAVWKGYRVAEMEVSHAPRKHGKSRYGGDRIPEGLLDLLAIMFLVRFQGRPSRFFAAVGTVLGALGFAISAYLAGLRLWTGSIQEKFPLLALGLVLMVVGVQLFSLGLFGELVAYHFRTRRPFEPAVLAVDSDVPVGGRDEPQPRASAEAESGGSS
jgi:glycosyltransferase involved in cell wall biosynthesis